MQGMQLLTRISRVALPFLLILGGVSVTSLGADQFESNENYWFKKGVEQFQKNDLENAQKSFEEGFKVSRELKSYYRFYLGEISLKNNKPNEAMTYFRQVLTESNSPRLRTQVLQKIIEQEVKTKNYQTALATIKKYRRYLRARQDRPQLNYYEAQIYKSLKQHAKMCQALENLYSKYPDAPLVASWNQDLDKNQFEGAPTNCSQTLGDFKERIRNLLWAGLDQKALGEVQIMHGRLKEKTPAIADAILAQFYVQEGEIGKSYELLAPHYETMKKNPEFASQYAIAAARKGDSDTAYKVFHDIHSTYPKSKMGRKALYQAAFLSYQFNNYERAATTFREYIQKYPKSGLKKDAEWHLAWLEYLRGNYDKAKKELKKQIGRRGTEERAQYWLAMTYMRDGDIEVAKKLFTELAKDPLKSFYSLSASFRLKSLPATNMRQKTLASISKTFINARSIFNVIKPFDEGNYYDDASEREQDLTFSVVDEDPRDVEEVDPEDIEDVPVVTEVMLPAQGDVITRVNLFRSLGLTDWARDEIQRFDRRKKDKKFLEEVWNEFSDLQLYNYSSDLARSVFAGQKASKDPEEVRNFYVKTYPKAFADSVNKASSKFDVKPEFIWAIMRTESQYKQEAVSPVGALGLMQVMPLTGRKMAEKINLKSFEPSQLLNPETGILVGTSYLQRLQKKFANEIPLSAAAYNAGPHRVKLWVSSVGPRDLDEFVDHIPFVETRNYVKRVVLAYQIYYWSQKKEFDNSIDLSKPYKFRMTEPVPLRETWEDI